MIAENTELEIKVFFVGIRGDWKMKGYLTGCHEYVKMEVCDECDANLQKQPYASDLNIVARWMATKKLPECEALKRIIGWHRWIFFADCAHSLYLGHARDFVGSLFLVLCEVLFPTEDVDTALHEIFLEVRSWGNANGYRVAIDDLNLAELSITDIHVDFPHFRGKAYDAKIFCIWLSERTRPLTELLPEESLAAQMLGGFIAELENSGIFLTEEQAAVIIMSAL